MPRIPVVVIAALLGCLGVARLVADGPYAKVAEIQIGGAPNFDYLNVDSAAHRLYVSHGAEIVVIDTTTRAVVGRIAETPGVHGIALAPALGRGFTSNGTEGKVSIVDLKTLQTIGKVDTAPRPDAILFDPGKQEVYAFNASGSATVIDAAKGTVVATIPLDGKPETGQADPALGRVFVNIESGNKGGTIAVIDVQTHTVVANWPVAPAIEPTGLALDSATHRLFSGGGPSVVMLDAKTGKVLADGKICGGTDATWFDPGTKMVFSSCSDGHISSFKESGDSLVPAQTIETERGARTMAVDPATHMIYVCATKLAPADPAVPNSRPRPLPDSLRAIVLGMP
jgi:DNA-binding beta-propeller fold protein YncE